jgi:hypothetical protein
VFNLSSAYGNVNVDGVRCHACDLDSDGIEEILTAPQRDPTGAARQVLGWDWDGGPLSGMASTAFDASPSYGVKVAGGNYGF